MRVLTFPPDAKTVCSWLGITSARIFRPTVDLGEAIRQSSGTTFHGPAWLVREGTRHGVGFTDSARRQPCAR
jgi:hypothetical protein